MGAWQLITVAGGVSADSVQHLADRRKRIADRLANHPTASFRLFPAPFLSASKTCPAAAARRGCAIGRSTVQVPSFER